MVCFRASCQGCYQSGAQVDIVNLPQDILVTPLFKGSITCFFLIVFWLLSFVTKYKGKLWQWKRHSDAECCYRVEWKCDWATCVASRNCVWYLMYLLMQVRKCSGNEFEKEAEKDI